MTLEQLAQKAMDYLDSVGVAAEYFIDGDAYGDAYLYVETSTKSYPHITWPLDDHDEFLDEIKAQYPLKSPS